MVPFEAFLGSSAAPPEQFPSLGGRVEVPRVFRGPVIQPVIEVARHLNGAQIAIARLELQAVQHDGPQVRIGDHGSVNSGRKVEFGKCRGDPLFNVRTSHFRQFLGQPAQTMNTKSMPRAYRSEPSFRVSPRYCSGAIYGGVPEVSGEPDAESVVTAEPKSMITKADGSMSSWALLRTRTLAGFKSKCRTPAAWAPA